MTGPRQSGKTTFLRHELGAGTAYVSLDDPLERSFAREDPNGFLDRAGDAPIILDEIQHAPELLPYLKLRIDRRRQATGRFFLSGSQQFAVMQGVGESLAGRIAILDLLPFSLGERTDPARHDLARTIWLGGYPEPLLHPERRDLWMRSYIQTYVERDLRQLRAIGDLRQFETFLLLAAARHAQS